MPQRSQHSRPDENVLWLGRPVKVPFVLHKNILEVTIIGLVLIAIGVTPLIVWTVQTKPLPIAAYAVISLVIIFGLSLVFVAIIPQLARHGNIEYMITNQRMIVQTGLREVDTQFLELDKIMDVYVHVGVIDRMYGTGTVCASNEANFFRRHPTYAFKIIDPFMRSTLWTMQAAFSKNAQLPLYASAIKDPYAVGRILQEAIEKARASSSTQERSEK